MDNILNWLWKYRSFISFVSFIILSIPLIAYQHNDKISEKIESPATIFGFFIIIYSIVFECMAQDAIRVLLNNPNNPTFTTLVISSTCILTIILCPFSKYTKCALSLSIALFFIALFLASTKNLLYWMNIGIVGLILPVIFFFVIEPFDELKKILFGKEYRKCNLALGVSKFIIGIELALITLYFGAQNIKGTTKNFKLLGELIDEFPDLCLIISLSSIWAIISWNFKDKAAADIVNKAVLRLSTAISLLFVIVHQDIASNIIRFMTIPSGISLIWFEIKKYLEDKK